MAATTSADQQGAALDGDHHQPLQDAVDSLASAEGSTAASSANGSIGHADGEVDKKSPCETGVKEEAWVEVGPGEMTHCIGGTTVVGATGEKEIFRSVWKYYKRNATTIAAYVRQVGGREYEDSTKEEQRGASMKKHKTVENRVACLDFENLHNSPRSLSRLVEEVEIAPSSGTCLGMENVEEETSERDFDDLGVDVRKAFKIRGRPGVVFIPNPFKTPDDEARWIAQLAETYPGSPTSQRNILPSGETAGALDKGLRWATLGFHYDWKNRLYSEEARSPFPRDLSDLAVALATSVGCNLIPETAIINYYDRKATMGGHKDDAEWTDEAPVVSISFGNAGVYVLGGDSQSDVGPPPPIPLIIRNGDIVVLGGASRMNLHGVPCMLSKTMPRSTFTALARRNAINQSTIPPQPTLADYMASTRINVNVRQVRTRLAILSGLKRLPK